MGLADEVRAEPPLHKKLEWIRVQLGDEAAELDELLADPLVSVTAIWRLLLARGFPVSQAGVQKWAQAARR